MHRRFNNFGFDFLTNIGTKTSTAVESAAANAVEISQPAPSSDSTGMFSAITQLVGSLATVGVGIYSGYQQNKLIKEQQKAQQQAQQQADALAQQQMLMMTGGGAQPMSNKLLLILGGAGVFVILLMVLMMRGGTPYPPMPMPMPGQVGSVPPPPSFSPRRIIRRVKKRPRR